MEFSGPGVWPRDSADHRPVAGVLKPDSSTYQFARRAHRAVFDGRLVVDHHFARACTRRGSRHPCRRRSTRVRSSASSATPASPDQLPRRCESGMRTSVKYTSLKFAPPEICLIGFISTPGLFMFRKVREALCFGTVGSERVTRMPQIAVMRARRPGLLAVDHPFVAAFFQTAYATPRGPIRPRAR